MKSLSSTIQLLKKKGIKVEVLGGQYLKVSPRDKLTPELIEAIKKHKEEIIGLLQPQPQWQETNSLFQASLSRVERCYIPSAIEKALRKAEVRSAFEVLDRVWKSVLEGKEDIASFRRALEQWETILLSSLKEFV